jgi:hypothetical protein
MLRPRQFNFLAAFESEHGQPDYVSRQTLVEFVEKHKGEKGQFGYTIRWPAWLTYNQPTDRPFKSLRRGQFRMTAAWEEYNAWKSQRDVATPPADAPPCGEGTDHNPEQSGLDQPTHVEGGGV